MTWAANASLISTRSMSPIAIPARPRAWREAATGPRPMISGDSAVTPDDTIRASGAMPSSAALTSLITITAAAPSLSGQQLPAVTVPSGRKTGFSAATFSIVVPGRGPSSAETTVPSGRVTGVISRGQKPDPFKFKNLGMLAYVGESKALADIPRARLHWRGALTYLFWRSAYLTRLVSMKNKILVLFDWIKTAIFGRDLSKF